MNTQALLDAITNELARVENSLAQLRQKVHVLSGAGLALPAARGKTCGTEPVLPVDLTTQGAYHPRGFWFRDRFHRCQSQKDIYVGLLREVSRESEGAMLRTAEALQTGRSRRYLAPDPTRLFKWKSPDWARSHSVMLADNWYADTNLSLEQKKQLIRRILAANGLHEGRDVVVLWTRMRATVDADSSPLDARWAMLGH